MSEERKWWPPARWFLILVAWIAIPAWSVVLIVTQASEGLFAMLVRAMGSIGVLYLLFLVLRPRGKGILELSNIKEREIEAGADQTESEPGDPAARWAIVTIALALAIGGVFYRVTQESFLHQTALFFIGIPTVLAITLAFTPRAKSATGMIIKGLTLALLLSGIVFIEGFVCILMAAPLFYAVGLAIGVPIDRSRKRKQEGVPLYSIVWMALLLLSVEGVTPATTLPQQETVRVTRTVDASARDVRRTLAAPPRFDDALPVYLRLGFPRPVSGSGNGLLVGDRRTIVFGDESPMEPMGDSHQHTRARRAAPEGGGFLELRIVRSLPGVVVFEPVQDATAFTHWIGWGRSIVRWKSLDSDSTEVTWTLHFQRRLSPSWYFGPFQRYAGTKAAGYLIDTTATP